MIRLLTAALLVALYAVGPGTGPWCRSLVESARLLYANRNSSREARSAALLGDAWRLVDQAARRTPPDARILIPDGAAADPLSNRTWCAYYLYPRRILRRGDITGPIAGQVDFELVFTPDEKGIVDHRGGRP